MSLILVLGGHSSVEAYLNKFGDRSKNILVSRNMQTTLNTTTGCRIQRDIDFTTKCCDAPRNTVIIDNDLNPEMIPEYVMKFVINDRLDHLFTNIDWIVMTELESIATLVLRAKPDVVILSSDKFIEWYGPTNNYAMPGSSQTLVVFHPGAEVRELKNPHSAKVVMTLHCVKISPYAHTVLEYLNKNFDQIDKVCDIMIIQYNSVRDMPHGGDVSLTIGKTCLNTSDSIIKYLETVSGVAPDPWTNKDVFINQGSNVPMKHSITIYCVKDKQPTVALMKYLTDHFDALDKKCDITIEMVTKHGEMPPGVGTPIALQHDGLWMSGYEFIVGHLETLICT